MEPPTSSHPPSAPGPAILTTTLASPGRGLVASGPLLVPAPPDLPEADLPVQHRFLLRLPGEERILNATIVVDRLPPSGPGWAVFQVSAGGLHVALKLEA